MDGLVMLSEAKHLQFVFCDKRSRNETDIENLASPDEFQKQLTRN